MRSQTFWDSMASSPREGDRLAAAIESLTTQQYSELRRLGLSVDAYARQVAGLPPKPATPATPSRPSSSASPAPAAPRAPSVVTKTPPVRTGSFTAAQRAHLERLGISEERLGRPSTPDRDEGADESARFREC